MKVEWAMCLGGASCVWDDVLAWEEVYGRQWDGVIIAVNDIGSHWPREFHHWVSLHPNKFPRWKALRERQRLPLTRVETWGKITNYEKDKQYAQHVLDPWPGGSSGMFSVQVALHLGCTRVVLCGIPMTQTPHFAESREFFAKEWLQAAGHWRAWPRQLERMGHCVRSMSGRTRETLGAPTLDWLLDAKCAAPTFPCDSHEDGGPWRNTNASG